MPPCGIPSCVWLSHCLPKEFYCHKRTFFCLSQAAFRFSFVTRLKNIVIDSKVSKPGSQIHKQSLRSKVLKVSESFFLEESNRGVLGPYVGFIKKTKTTLQSGSFQWASFSRDALNQVTHKGLVVEHRRFPAAIFAQKKDTSDSVV